MKKYFLSLLLGCLFMASCSETDCSSLNEFKLVESTTEYTAKACTGYIKYEGGESEDGEKVVATSSEDWCKVSTADGLVTVSLDDNYSIDSRTAMVSLTSGSEVKRVPVTQLGRVTDYSSETDYSCFYPAQEITYSVRNSFGVEVGDTPDWITYTLTDDGVKFSLTPNTTGAVREGKVTVNLPHADVTKTLSFVQRSSADLYGAWKATYVDVLTGDTVTTDVNVVANAVKSMVAISGLFNSANGNFYAIGTLNSDGGYELNGCAAIGAIGKYYTVYQLPYLSTKKVVKDAYNLKCELGYDDNGKLCCSFVDNNDVSGVQVLGFFAYAIPSIQNASSIPLAAFANLTLTKE